jgi:hypothetical protein
MSSCILKQPNLCPKLRTDARIPANVAEGQLQQGHVQEIAAGLAAKHLHIVFDRIQAHLLTANEMEHAVDHALQARKARAAMQLMN